MLERNYYLAFSNFSGVGPIKFEKLLKHFGSAEKAWKAQRDELEPILKPALTKKFEDFRKEFDFDKYLEKLKKQKIFFVCLADKEYPGLLKKIPNPPIVLFVKGNVRVLFTDGAEVASKIFLDSACLQNAVPAKISPASRALTSRATPPLIAIVGTRKISTYGKSITELFAGSLASSGLIIVSGMAFGVDGVAHASTIEAGGKTIAVLGNGVDLPYPRENQKLYEEILDSGGAVVSEFPPGHPPSVGSFPSRNRIVAGLSDGVLVTEGASDSGSLITANFALGFGRKVFAVPGPITSSLSAAPLRLIEKGAKLVITPEDILKELKVSRVSEVSKVSKGDGKDLTKEESLIIGLLENENLHFDEISRRLKIDSSKTGTILSLLEIKGIIKSLGGGNFSLV
ncbi:MAG: DNA-protecting protein DprA [Candidatus Levybacteria bacterium]|nr:DNA-protecting protein DprA [Candidatus Levybacteria bacterium]